MQRIAHRLRQFNALAPEDRRIVMVAVALLPAFRLALGLLGLQRLQARLHRQSLPSTPHPALDELKRTGALVNATSHRVLGPDNCLTRSLYLWWLLRRRGVRCELRIGVRMIDGALAAHAWVEHAGVPVNDRDDVGERFGAFEDAVSPSRFLLP